MEILICLLLIIFTWFSYVWYKNILNPITIFVSWSMLLILLGMWCALISNYNWHTLAILFGSYFIFCCGVMFGNKIRLKETKNFELDFKRLNKCIVFIAIVVDICVVLYFWDLIANVGILQIFSDLAGFNQEVQDGYFAGKIYYQLMFTAIPLSMIILYHLLKNKPSKKWLLIIQFIICFLPYVTVRRDTLFNMFLLNVIVWYLVNIYKTNSSKASLKRNLKIISLIVVAVTFMSFSQKVLSKSLSLDDFEMLGINIPDYLVDPFVYLLGSFPYFDVKMNFGGTTFVFPFVATFRIPLMYLQPIFGGGLDLTSPFALDFINIGSKTKLLFNTAPIQYYSLIEFGMLFPIFYFILGSVSGYLYKKFCNNQGIKEVLLLAVMFSVLFWSVRSYILIYVNVWITILTIYIVCKIVLVKKG